jgi:hypothetical protein
MEVSDRHLAVDTKALVFVAMNAFSSSAVPNVSKADGGNVNAVYSLQFPNGFRVAARIPYKNYRAPGRIESVVAMMTLARLYTRLPVPEVYAWHHNEKNPVGAPYILMEWAPGIPPWKQWDELLPEDRTHLLDEIASYHARSATPLPFQGIGSIYFADLPPEVEVCFSVASAYRLGPLCRGPVCTMTPHRGISIWPQTIPTTLRDFWVELWQHEVDSIAQIFGADRATDVTENLGYYFDDPCTVGDFLDAADTLLALIWACPLPSPSQPELYCLSFAPTDYAFRNMLMDPDTRRITALLDWDDVYTLPFLLCSRYPEDFCPINGSDERWDQDGAFEFLPIDEEEEGSIPERNEVPLIERASNNLEALEDDELGSAGASKDEAASDETSEANHGAAGLYEDSAGDDGTSDEEYDAPRRRKDTLLRRQYEQMLSAHDPRFGIDGFWDMRKDPLKITHLVMHGWIEWVLSAEWVKKRAEELKSS